MTQAPKRISRRFFRISLGTLMLVVTVFCVWLGRISQLAISQQRAVEIVEAARGTVHYSYEATDWPLSYTEFPSSRTFDRSKVPPGPTWLRNTIGDDFFRSAVHVDLEDRRAASQPMTEALAKLPNLIWLNLALNDVTDSMLPTIGSMKQLRVLCLGRNLGVSDDGLRHITSLSDLEELNLGLNPNVTGSFLIDAMKMKSLRELDLQDTPFDGDNLRYLRGHTRLHRLTIRKTLINDEDLKHLATMPELKLLDIGETAITERGIGYLADRVPLIHLYVEGPGVNDNWVPHLAKMTSLEYLAAWNTSISDESFELLKKALPECDIDHR